MNKLNKLFAGFAAVAMLAACSNEEPVAPGDNTIPAGEKAYLTVNIQSAGDIYGAGYSRSTTDGGFADGDEHTVANAHFFFFDANGIYVGRTNPNNPNSWVGSDNENIEWIGKNVIVLEDLQGNEYPTYMLTVLNLPTLTDENGDTYTPAAGDSYEKVTAALAQYQVGANYVMSTTSYYKGATATDVNHDNKYPMLTKLDKSNFSLEPRAANEATPVEVYVERLAGKVTVTTDPQTLKPAKDDLYLIDATVFGEGNNGNEEGNHKLYVRLEGWTLNALAKNSYISKQLLAGWETKAPFAGWDKPEYFRSFWANSWVYDKADFAKGNNLGYFNYIDYETATKTEYGKSNYCNENTNVAANILKNKLVVPAYATHATLAATVCDENGEGLNLVEYNKVLFTKADYIKYVLSILQKEELLYYTKEVKTAEDTNEAGETVITTKVEYKELPLEAFDWFAANNGTGSIYIAAKADAAEALWVKDEAGKYVEVDVAGKTDIEVMNEGLLAYQKDTTKMAKAIGFNGGRMVYNVPIEHFAGNGRTAEDEGYYGVVRNHWYNLSISKIVRVGHGIFDPNETIIPDEPEDPRYYVSANINILSWKVINQGGIEL